MLGVLIAAALSTSGTPSPERAHAGSTNAPSAANRYVVYLGGVNQTGNGTVLDFGPMQGRIAQQLPGIFARPIYFSYGAASRSHAANAQEILQLEGQLDEPRRRYCDGWGEAGPSVPLRGSGCTSLGDLTSVFLAPIPALIRSIVLFESPVGGIPNASSAEARTLLVPFYGRKILDQLQLSPEDPGYGVSQRRGPAWGGS